MNYPLIKIIKHHAKKYPLSQVQDFVKLTYQHFFGNGHFIDDKKNTLNFLKKEYVTIKKKHECPIEPIGNGYSRIYLAGISSLNISLELLNNIFLHSSLYENQANNFQEALDIICRLADSNIFSFTSAQAKDYISSYKSLGCPIVSHTDKYKDAYAPAYRVVRNEFISLLPLIRAIDNLLSDKKYDVLGDIYTIIGIDGNIASGKTSATKILCDYYNANVIHTDDFYTPFELRTKQRLSEPKGNIHYERLIEEVLLNMVTESPFTYNVYDCKTGTYSQKRTLKKPGLTFIEGTYAHLPSFLPAYDITAFFTINNKTQLSRLSNRCQNSSVFPYINKWLPNEKKYFDYYSVRESSDIIINNFGCEPFLPSL